MSVKSKQLKTRKGIASLELVLGFPFLLLIFCIIFIVATAGIKTTGAVKDARYEVWKMRDMEYSADLDDQVQVADTRPMSITAGWGGDEMPGETGGGTTNSFKLYNWMKLGNSLNAEGSTNLVSGTWDYEEMTVFTDRPGGPHFETLEMIADLESIIGFSLPIGPLEAMDAILDWFL